MQPERKLWIAVLMRGIADCDTKFTNGARYPSTALAMTQEAQAWRNSDSFAWYCEMAGLELKFARNLPSATAAHALTVLAFKE